MAALPQQRRAVGSVEDQKVLIRQAAAKMPAQQRQYVVFWVDDRTEHAILFLKADKLDKTADLVIDIALQHKRRVDIRVAQHLHGAGAFVKATAGEPQ